MPNSYSQLFNHCFDELFDIKQPLNHFFPKARRHFWIIPKHWKSCSQLPLYVRIIDRACSINDVLYICICTERDRLLLASVASFLFFMSKEQIGNEVALARSHSRSYCVYIPCLDAWARTIESSDFPLPLPLCYWVSFFRHYNCVQKLLYTICVNT